jgi:hypothetical protein
VAHTWHGKMKVCTRFRLENLEEEVTRNVQAQMKDDDDLREKKYEAVDLIQLVTLGSNGGIL